VTFYCDIPRVNAARQGKNIMRDRPN